MYLTHAYVYKGFYKLKYPCTERHPHSEDSDLHMLMLHPVGQMASVPFNCAPYQMLSDCRALQYEVPLNHSIDWKVWEEGDSSLRSLSSRQSQMKQTSVIAFVTKHLESMD